MAGEIDLVALRAPGGLLDYLDKWSSSAAAHKYGYASVDRERLEQIRTTILSLLARIAADAAEIGRLGEENGLLNESVDSRIEQADMAHAECEAAEAHAAELEADAEHLRGGAGIIAGALSVLLEWLRDPSVPAPPDAVTEAIERGSDALEALTRAATAPAQGEAEKFARARGWIDEREYNGEDDGVRHLPSGDWAEDWDGAIAQGDKSTPPSPDRATEALREAFRAVDQKDWNWLFSRLGDGGHDQFWRAVFTEVRAALHAAGEAGRELTREESDGLDRALRAASKIVPRPIAPSPPQQEEEPRT